MTDSELYQKCEMFLNQIRGFQAWLMLIQKLQLAKVLNDPSIDDNINSWLNITDEFIVEVKDWLKKLEG